MTRSEKRRRFPDSDTWSLDITVAKFILPRLRRLKKIWTATVVPQPDGLNKKIFNKIIYSLAKIAKDNPWEPLKNEAKVQEGLDLLGKHFRELWW